MATYSYRCRRGEHRADGGSADAHHDDATFDLIYPIGQAPASTECPHCGSDAVRVFTAPRLSLVHRGALAALDRAERSRTEPEVVSALPAGAGRRPARAPRGVDPRWSTLPRA